MPSTFAHRALITSLMAAFALVACGGGDSDSTPTPELSIPKAPQGLGTTDSAPVADETTTLPFVDYAYTNQRGDARYATRQTNAGVRVVDGFLKLWTPSTLIVDAGVTAAANGSFPAVTASSWSGIPGDATDGTPVNAAVLNANIQYVVDATAARTPAQELAAYLDDRRQKGYSVVDGMARSRRPGAQLRSRTTTITDIAPMPPPLSTTTRATTTAWAAVPTPASAAWSTSWATSARNGSTEPAKRFYKYARPWRWSSSVKVVPALEPAKSSTPTTDAASSAATRRGHARCHRPGLRVARAVPGAADARARIGENRIYAGMHSPLDVIGGRVHAQAVAAASLSTGSTGGSRCRLHTST
jgi:hypothetical protein